MTVVLSAHSSYYLSLGYQRLHGIQLSTLSGITESSSNTDTIVVIVFIKQNYELGHVFGISNNLLNSSRNISACRAALIALSVQTYISVKDVYIITKNNIGKKLDIIDCETLCDSIPDTTPIYLTHNTHESIVPTIRDEDSDILYFYSETTLTTTGISPFFFSVRPVYIKDIYPYPHVFSRKLGQNLRQFLSEFYAECENPMSPDYLSADYEDLLSTEMSIHAKLRLLPQHPVYQRYINDINGNSKQKILKVSSDIIDDDYKTTVDKNTTITCYDQVDLLNDTANDTIEDVQASGTILRNFFNMIVQALQNANSIYNIQSISLQQDNTKVDNIYAAGVIYSNGTTSISPVITPHHDPLEYLYCSILQNNQQSNTKLEYDQNGKRTYSDLQNSECNGIKPLFTVMVDINGICHSPFATSRKLYTDNNFSNIYSLFHDVDGSLRFEEFKNLLPPTLE